MSLISNTFLKILLLIGYRDYQQLKSGIQMALIADDDRGGIVESISYYHGM